MPDMIPISQAAIEFGVSEMTIYRHIKKGQVTRFRRPMDRRTYVDRDELRELLKFRPIQSGSTK